MTGPITSLNIEGVAVIVQRLSGFEAVESDLLCHRQREDQPMQKAGSWVPVLGLLGWIGAAGVADAQTRPPAAGAAAQRPAQARAAQPPRWEIDVRGGLAAASSSDSGDLTLPPPGPLLTSTNPQFPTRESASWFFGNGAEQLNGALGELGLPARIEPLDAALGRASSGGGTGGTFGVGIRREISRRFMIEGGVDLFLGGGGSSDELDAAVAAARTSFESAFSALFATGPLTNVAVAASSDGAAGSSREIAVTGALEWRFGARAGVTPYLTFGAGVIGGLGDGPAASLEGAYQFRIAGEVPVSETDRVTIRIERRTVPVALVGGGIRRTIGTGLLLRLDARVLVGENNTRTVIDASPGSTPGSPADYIELFTNPGLQFSNNPSTGRQSTLSGPGLDGFEAFRGDGLQKRFIVTIGVAKRF
jgi:hypothetical protein